MCFIYSTWCHKLLVLIGKQLEDPRILTDVGDVPVQEIRDCGVDDDRLMTVISDSVKLVMEQVSHLCNLFYLFQASPVIIFFLLSIFVLDFLALRKIASPLYFIKVGLLSCAVS